MRKLKRNDLCWCGSGKKYKKCHMESDLRRERMEKSLRTLNQWVAYHGGALAVNVRLEAEGNAAIQAAIAPLGTDLNDTQTAQIALYDVPVDGAPLIAKATTPDERHAQSRDSLRTVLAKSVLSLFEVTEVKRGKGVRLRDRLQDQDRWVPSADLSQTLEPMQAVVGRIIVVNERNVLVDGWEAIGFRGRKAVFRQWETARDNADVDSADAQRDWIKSQSVAILQSARAAAEATPFDVEALKAAIAEASPAEPSAPPAEAPVVDAPADPSE
jgi:hypothetical protein